MDKVFLRSKVGAFATSTSVGGQKLDFNWNTANNFVCEVPTKVEYMDQFSKQNRTAYDNYAQVLLSSYPDILEIASVEEKPVVVETKPEKTKKEKEKKNE